jgi:hypothetical protein
VVGLVLRIAGARGDLWLDEIWSLDLARLAHSAMGVFTELHHDNNHHLNTLYLYLLGDGASPLCYRLAAVAAGSAAVAIVALRPLGGGRIEALASVVLVSLSYVLVHYSSEARGYALAAFFALAALHAMARYLETRRWAWAMLFAATAVLGILSHLTFLYVLLGLISWSSVEVFRTRPSRGPDATFLACHGPPLLAFALLWLVDLRYLVVGGTAPYEIANVLRELLRSTLGLPRGPLELLGAVALLAAGYEVWRMARGERTEWIFFATALLGAPALVLLARPGFLAPRYFLVSVPFFLLLVGSSLARLFRRGGWWRTVAVLGLVVFVAGNGARIGRLLRDGRGHYREAFACMVENTRGGVVTVGGDHDWRTLMVLSHLAKEVPGAEPIEYLGSGQWSPAAPLWVLRHDFSEEPRAEPGFLAPTGRWYVLVRQFPYAGLSGWNWYLYRMASAP